MNAHLTLVLTRKEWVVGNVEANFRTVKRYTNRRSAIKEIATLGDADFVPLGIRDENNWVWQQ